MEMRIDELQVLVRSRLDELGANDSDMIDVETDNSEIDRIIRDGATAALRHLLMEVDVSLLKGVSCDAPLSIDGDGVGLVRVPDDCLRVLDVKLGSWKGAALLIDERNPVYGMQGDEFSRGIPERPVAVMVNRQDGRYLELYSTKRSDDVLGGFHYVRVPAITLSPIGDEVIDVPDVLRDAFVYYVAGLTAMAYREAELGERLLGVSKELV